MTVSRAGRVSFTYVRRRRRMTKLMLEAGAPFRMRSRSVRRASCMYFSLINSGIVFPKFTHSSSSPHPFHAVRPRLKISKCEIVSALAKLRFDTRQVGFS
jgi:hypothetical protein